jgi:hypothetical protein
VGPGREAFDGGPLEPPAGVADPKVALVVLDVEADLVCVCRIGVLDHVGVPR